MRKSMKLAELATLAGVSTATVSRALSNHPAVRAETRRRIRELASEHEVRPNQLARSLRMRSTGAIGLVLPLGHARSQHLTDPFFLTLLGFLADLLVERGYDILLSRVLPDGGEWLERLVDSGRVDGLLLVGQSDQYDAIERLAARYRPLIVWGVHREGQHQVTVGSDNRLGGRLAGEHLIGLGWMRLLFVGDPGPPEFADRLVGFRQAAGAVGAEVEVLETSMDPAAVHAAMDRRLRIAPAPQGIFAASDVVAMSVLRALGEAGIVLPDDAGVVGYDDVTLAAHTLPPLTTIRQDLQAGAALMVDGLFNRIAGGDVRSQVIPTELIIRMSTLHL